MMCLGQLPATDEDISFTLRIGLKEWQKTKETLMQLCIINSDGVITNWDSRQYVSDSSTERVRKFRETLQKRSGNVAVTAMKRDETSPDTDTDTEQTQIQKQKQKQRRSLNDDIDPRFEEFWGQYPNKQKRQDALKAWRKINPDDDLFATIMNSLSKFKMSDGWTKNDGQYVPHPPSWLNSRRWEDVIAETKRNLSAFEICQKIARGEE
jgi:hypothetical protein